MRSFFLFHSFCCTSYFLVKFTMKAIIATPNTRRKIEKTNHPRAISPDRSNRRPRIMYPSTKPINSFNRPFLCLQANLMPTITIAATNTMPIMFPILMMIFLSVLCMVFIRLLHIYYTIFYVNNQTKRLYINKTLVL